MTSTPTTNESPPSRLAFDEDIFCPQCGYNLRGVESDRCPECGREFDRATLRVSAIPWVHRREIGGSALFRTVWLITTHPRCLSQELSRPVLYRDAREFRLRTILFVGTSLFMPALIAIALVPPSWIPFMREVLAMVWPVAAVGIALVLALGAVAGLPSYAFYPKDLPIETQNRAVALTCYACAPLAWAPMLVYMISAYFVWEPFNHPSLVVRLMGATLLALCVGGLTAIPVLWWLSLLYLAKRVFQPPHTGRLLFIAALPILWPLTMVLIIGGAVGVSTYVALFVDSLR